MSVNSGRQPRSTGGESEEESFPLIGREDREPARSIRFQRAHLALPVVFFGFLSATIAATTSIQIMRIVACQFWWSKHDPSRIPSDGNLPDELCDVQGVQQLFALLLQVFTIMDVCGSVLTSSPIGTLSAKFGRKPLFVIVAAIATIAPLILIAALRTTAVELIFVSSLLSAVAGPRQLLLLSTMFVIDSTPNPAPILSVLEGSIYFGLAISYTLGGVITTRSGNLTYVFWIQSIISGIMFVYCIVAIPETFGPSERAARAAEVEAEFRRGTIRLGATSRSSSLERVRDTIVTFARPFALLLPRRDPITGERNKRLFLLSIGMTLALIGSAYVVEAWLVFATSQFHVNPAQAGYTLSILSSIKTVYLLLVLPTILKWGRPFYNRHWRTNPAANDLDSPSSHFDVHMIAVSWSVDSIAALGVALARRLGTTTGAIMLTSIGSGASPSISTVVSASVDPLARGEALAAIALVRSIAEFLSPVLLGLVMNMTIGTDMSKVVFFVSMTLLALGAGIITFIQDSDRYIADQPRCGNDLDAGGPEMD